MEPWGVGLVSGGLAASFVTGILVVLQVIFNKKLRTPSDEESQHKNELAARNEIIEQHKQIAKDAKEEAKAAHKVADEANAKADATDKRLDEVVAEFNEFKAEWISWGYRAVNTIRRLGTDDDVPKPTPKGLQI